MSNDSTAFWLLSAFASNRSEVDHGEFGDSTLEAVRELQRKHGLRECDEIDEPTHAVLIGKL